MWTSSAFAPSKDSSSPTAFKKRSISTVPIIESKTTNSHLEPLSNSRHQTLVLKVDTLDNQLPCPIIQFQTLHRTASTRTTTEGCASPTPTTAGDESTSRCDVFSRWRCDDFTAWHANLSSLKERPDRRVNHLYMNKCRVGNLKRTFFRSSAS